MFCKFCGKEIPNESNFCLYCGGKVQERVDDSIEEYPVGSLGALYEDVMQNKVLKILKSPSTAKYPPYDESMIKEVGVFSTYKVIESYVDCMNSYGATTRAGVRIKFDENNNFLGYAFKEATSSMYSMYRM